MQTVHRGDLVIVAFRIDLQDFYTIPYVLLNAQLVFTQMLSLHVFKMSHWVNAAPQIAKIVKTVYAKNA